MKAYWLPAAMILAVVTPTFAQETPKSSETAPPATAEMPEPPRQVFGAEEEAAPSRPPFRPFEKTPYDWSVSIGGGGFSSAKNGNPVNLDGGWFLISAGPSTRFAEIDFDFGLGNGDPEIGATAMVGLHGRLYPLSRPRFGNLTVAPYLGAGANVTFELGDVGGTGEIETVLLAEAAIGFELGVTMDKTQAVIFMELGAGAVNGGGNDLPLNLKDTDSARTGRGGIRFRF